MGRRSIFTVPWTLREEAAAGADVVMGFVALEVLIFVIELHMARAMTPFVVVFDVVARRREFHSGCLRRRLDVEVALLRRCGREESSAMRPCRRASELLWVAHQISVMRRMKKRAPSGRRTGARRNPCIKMTIHAGHRAKKNSRIA